MTKVIPMNYRTQIVLVDDDQVILDVLSKQIIDLGFRVQAFHSATDALEWLNQRDEQPLFEPWMVQDEETALSANLHEIYREISNENRHNRVSVVVTDYDMPDMDGLTFLRQIRAPNVQKILLTGIADESLAVKAFNRGEINSYIKKHDPEIYDRIEDALESGAHQYFERESSVFMHVIGHSLYGQALKYPEFSDFLERIFGEYNVGEYYLLDSIGSYLLKDREDKYHVLYLFNQELLDCQADDLESEFGADSELNAEIQQIRGYQKALCTHPCVETGDNDLEKTRDLIHAIRPLELGADEFFYVVVPVQKLSD
ncbi:MAG: response regulator [Candidatus Paracaedibacteraceae bacterium]|nr:response regulator [Candidatus Paracaedibacteraceae bacterium]